MMNDAPNEGLAQGMEDGSFSFRWGVPVLQDRFMCIPNFFFDCYAEAGVTGTEFLLILHLARYRFEKRGSQSRPSLSTVARQMGCTQRALQKTLAGLEERGLIRRCYRPGYTTVYEFSDFSRAVQAVKLSTGANPSSPPEHLGGEPQFGGGANPGSPEEERMKRTNKHDDADGLTDEQSRAFDLLVDFGVFHSAARQIARQRDLAVVRGWLQYAENAPGLENPPAFVVRRLRDGEPVPPPAARDNHRDESVTAVCPACSRRICADMICPDCGKCHYYRGEHRYGCCECEKPQQ
jgi:hypothetical protein